MSVERCVCCDDLDSLPFFNVVSCRFSSFDTAQGCVGFFLVIFVIDHVDRLFGVARELIRVLQILIVLAKPGKSAFKVCANPGDNGNCSCWG